MILPPILPIEVRQCDTLTVGVYTNPPDLGDIITQDKIHNELMLKLEPLIGRSIDHELLLCVTTDVQTVLAEHLTMKQAINI